jgi:Tol biopolymer transport system component
MTRARRLLTLLPLLALLAGCGSSGPPTVPDLVFVSTRDGDYALFGSTADGGHEHRLSDEKGDPATPAGLFFQLEPAWSPDGRLIAFASRRDGRSHIYVMRPDGTGVHRITSGPADDDHPTWSPDGRKIALAREGALFIIPSAGGPARRFARGFGNAASPAWSPDGKLIAYDYRRPGFSIREIWVAPVDGGTPRQITKLGEVSARPSWSPDGHRLAFDSNAPRADHYEIYSIGLDGRRLRRETTSSVDTIDPAWAPGGGQVAFARDGAIWVVDRSGHARKLTSDRNDSSPAWRPRARG